MTEVELLSAIWAVLNTPNASDEEKVLGLKGFLRMTTTVPEAEETGESDFWAAFTYDSGADRWDLAPGMEPIGVLVLCLAKIKADKAAIAAALAASRPAETGRGE